LRFRVPVRDISLRLVTGAYIAHAGLDKWHGSVEQAKGLHGAAAAAFPILQPIRARPFLKLLAAGELATGTLLLAPVVPNAIAGLALTGFSGALVAMYARTPAMRKPGSIWPSRTGIAVSKDIWLLGIGLSLLASALTRGRRTSEAAGGGPVRSNGNQA
jgi:uncharacterized membrane protein YphA (DoxX/SURF4 family)